jgi:antitoxin VapB
MCYPEDVQRKTKNLGHKMALNIKSDVADNLARQLAKMKGQSITEVVISSLKDSLEREAVRPHAQSLAQSLSEIGRRCAALPDLDTRTPEEILGFDAHGLPS